MAEYITIKRRVSLDAPISPESLPGFTYMTEHQAHEFIISVRKNGEKETITGSVSANVIRPNGTTIFLQGSISDGDAVVRLHRDCYNIPGRLKISIFNTSGGVTTCIYSATYTNDRSTTDNVIDAGDVVPDISDVVAAQEAAQAAITAANTAAQTANTAAQNVGSIVARPYSSSSTYTAGDYCTNNGNLYKANQDISTAEEWTASHWTQIVMGDEVTDLKSVVGQLQETKDITNLYVGGSQIQLNVGIGNTVNPTAKSTTGTASIVYPCKAGDVFDVSGFGYSKYRLWGLTDNEYKLLSVADAPPPNTRHDVITAIQDGFFISNVNTSEARSILVVSSKDFATKKEAEDIFADGIIPYDEVLKDTTDIKSLIIKPYKINSNVGIGNIVDPTPISESACGCLCYSCKKGDRFTLTGTGYSSIRLWAFTDTEYKLLSIKIGSGTETDSVHVAEQDGYFIVNINTNKAYSLSVYTFKDIGKDERFNEMFPASRFYKPVSWVGSDLGRYIHVNHGDFDLFTSATTAAQYYQLWNDLATESSGYITSTELGLASDNTTTMYAYDLKPIAGYVGPKLFIVCGQHGFEKAGPFGLYYFVRELVENYRDNPTLMYLRNWCEMIIIPLMNPYGFNNNVYVNANGVNLNRNWPTTVWRQGTEGTTNYGGPSAGSEIETQYAVSLFSNHDDSFVLTDIHTNGQTAVSNYSSVMWQAFETEINEDEYSKLCVEAAKKEINDLSSAFCIDYPEDCPTYTQIGHYSLDTATGGLATIYAREHNMLAETVEGFPAWPNGATYKPSCHQANSDIYANWFRCVLAVYERLGGNKYTTT